MNKKQYMMMAAFLCATTTSMAAPVNVTAEQSYDSKILQTEGHAPLETSASVVSSDKVYRLRQGDELTIQVVQQAGSTPKRGGDPQCRLPRDRTHRSDPDSRRRCRPARSRGGHCPIARQRT